MDYDSEKGPETMEDVPRIMTFDLAEQAAHCRSYNGCEATQQGRSCTDLGMLQSQRSEQRSKLRGTSSTIMAIGALKLLHPGCQMGRNSKTWFKDGTRKPCLSLGNGSWGAFFMGF